MGSALSVDDAFVARQRDGITAIANGRSSASVLTESQRFAP